MDLVNATRRPITTSLGESMQMRLSRRQWLRGLLAVGLTTAALGCGVDGPGTRAAPPAASPSSVPSPLTLTLANSELAVGHNRFALGLIADGRPLVNADTRYEFFQVSGQTAVKRGETDAQYRALDSQRGIYVANVLFDAAGSWGVQATVMHAVEPPLVARTSFQVLEHGNAPMPGQPAIASRTPTVADVADPREICSGEPPCAMHEVSVAAALARQVPLVVTFSTPGFCTSQLCAPVLGEVERVRAHRATQAEFVHVEIYKDPRTLTTVEAVQEWGLRSEPWVFVVDRGGQIVQRMESITTAEEIEAVLAAVI